MKKELTFIFIFLFPGMFTAQSNLWTHYYSHNHVTAIASRGDYVWIGYDCGLERRNIKSREVSQYFTYNSGLVASNSVNTIAIDSSGNLWTSTGELITNELFNGIINGGTVKFTGTEWKNYSERFGEQHLPADITFIAADPHNVIWLCEDNKFSVSPNLIRFDEKKDSVYVAGIDTRKPGSAIYLSARKTVLSAAFDSMGSIWFVTPYTGMYRFDGKNWERINTENSDIPSDQLTSLVIDRNGTKWIGTKNKGLARYGSSGWKVYNRINSLLPDDRVTALTVDSTGNLWIGTAGSGVAKFDGSHWELFSFGPSALPDSTITCLTVDSKGDLWAGTLHGGYATYNGSEWIAFNTSNSKLKSNDALAAADPSGSVWIASEGEIFKVTDSVWTKMTPENSGLPLTNAFDQANLLQLTADTKGSKWFISLNSAIMYNYTSWFIFDSANTNSSINSFRRAAFDSAGNAWFTVNNGLAKYNGKEWIKYIWDSTAAPNSDAVPFTPVSVKADGSIFSGNNSGIYRFDGTKWSEYYRGYKGYAGVNDMEIDHKGSLWAAMGIFEGGSRIWGSITEFSGDSITFSKNGFYNTVAVDNSNNIWAGGRTGLTRIDAKDNSTISFNTSNSVIPENNVLQISIDKFNKKWIITKSGISVFTYEERLPVGINEEGNINPAGYSLQQNYPNPFNPFTTISYSLPDGSVVSLKVFDILGREIAVLENGFRPAGNHKVLFNDSSLHSGVYIYIIQAGKFRDSRKFILLK